jgi:ComF family protein
VNVLFGVGTGCSPSLSLWSGERVSTCRSPHKRQARSSHALSLRFPAAACLAHRPGLDGLDRLVAVTTYKEAVLIRKALHRLKYRGLAVYAEPLGGLMATLSPHLQVPAVDVFCPVPLHWSRRLWRGFNQAELLARPLAREVRVPVVSLLRRQRGGQQVGRSAEERREAWRDAFVAPGPVPAHVVLVDDVVTTGATVLACASALRAAGAERVSVACLAYAA